MFFWTVNMANIILIYISKANDWFTNMRYGSQNVCKGWNNIVASLQHLVMVKSSTSLTKNKWKLYVKWTKDNGSVSLKSHKKSSMDLHQNRHQHFKERTPDGFFKINNYLNYIKYVTLLQRKNIINTIVCTGAKNENKKKQIVIKFFYSIAILLRI